MKLCCALETVCLSSYLDMKTMTVCSFRLFRYSQKSASEDFFLQNNVMHL